MVKTSATVKDVNPHDFVKAYAKHLKRSGKVELPKYIDNVKTSSIRELPAVDPDFYYVRAASIARKVYLRSGLGIGALRRLYGGPHDKGVITSHHGKAAGGLLRHQVHALEKMGVIELGKDGGRRITQTGQRDLDRIASQVHKKAEKARVAAEAAKLAEEQADA